MESDWIVVYGRRIAINLNRGNARRLIEAHLRAGGEHTDVRVFKGEREVAYFSGTHSGILYVAMTEPGGGVRYAPGSGS